MTGALIPNYARYDVEFERGEGVHGCGTTRATSTSTSSAGIAVCNTGHCHPHVVAAIREQAGAADARLATSSTPRRRCGWPSGWRSARWAARCSSANSGAEANEAALKLARKRKRGRRASSSLHGGFHGRTYGALSATPQETKQAPFAPLVPGFDAVAADGRRRRRRATTPRRVMLELVQGETGVHVAAATSSCTRSARPATSTARC